MLEHRIEVRDDADRPAGGVGRAAAGPDRECLRRRALLVALAEGARKQLVFGRQVELSSGGRSGSPCPTRCDDHPLTGDRVLAWLSFGQLEAPPPFLFSMNGVSRSIGAGKTIVVDCDEPSSSSVCRYRSCRATGCSSITFAASFNRSDAWYSP